MVFQGDGNDATDSWDHTGVLLVNLGTPEAPTSSGLRKYLAEFLWDPRVVEIPRPLWWLILHGLILRTRPKRSAHAYQSIWQEDGSPLLSISRRQQAAISHKLGSAGNTFIVELAMRYGKPSIPQTLKALKRQKVGRILILPLYPQYSCSTTASALDAVFDELKSWRRLPEIRTVNQYFDHEGYIQALAHSIRAHWEKHGKADKLLMSFHGTPKFFFQKGDPYYTQCQRTATLLAESLGLSSDQWVQTFQSRFGKAEWLQPYTDQTLGKLAKQGINSVQVVCPGFSADCLETLEEIQVENQEVFLEAGGKEYQYIPALNDSDLHIDFLSKLITQELR